MSSKTVVVKIGGGKGIDYELFLQDFGNYKNTILVHGGSHELDKISKKLDKPPLILKSDNGSTSRFTDRETMEIFNMVYCGKMNKMIVEKLQKLGVNAIGLSGIDGRIAEGSQNKPFRIIQNGKKKVIRNDMTGKVKTINIDLLNLLLINGYTPVITPPAISDQRTPINVDGDKLSGAIASNIGSKIFVILSNVPGLLKNQADNKSIIKNINVNEIDNYIEKYAMGRMKKKLIGAKEAILNGVSKVIIAGALKQNPITNALKGEGTIIS